MPIDIAWEALVGNATFVARSFAGDPKQVKELIKPLWPPRHRRAGYHQPVRDLQQHR
jgi:hypothetical protein